MRILTNPGAQALLATVIALLSAWTFTDASAQTFECVDEVLFELDGSTDTLEPGVTIGRTNPSGGSVTTTNLEISCGACSEATFEDISTSIGGGSICGYTAQVPVQLIQNDDLLCARSTTSGRMWEIDLRSWLSSNIGCIDNDLGASCALADDFTSYIRCEYRPAVPAYDVHWGALKGNFE